MVARLAHQTQKTAGIPNGLRSAVVDSVSTAGVMVNINGAVVGPFACLDASWPTPGQTVSVFRQDSTWLVLGVPQAGAAQWQPLTLLNNFTNSSPALQFRRLGPNLQLVGIIVSGATVGSGTAIGQLPTGFFPANQDVPGIVFDPTSGANLQLFCRTTSFLTMHGTWANGNTIEINVMYPLDM